MQGYEEPTGQAKITPGYNLPCKYVLHTVGPIVQGQLTKEHEEHERAAEIAVQKVRDYRTETNSSIEVIFNVWKDIDYEIYRQLLG